MTSTHTHKSAIVALIVVVLSAAIALVGCRSKAKREAEKSPPPPNYFVDASDIPIRVRKKLGGDVEAMEIGVYKDQLIITVRAGKAKTARYRFDKRRKWRKETAVPLMLDQRTKLDRYVFPFDDVTWKRIPDMVETAAKELDEDISHLLISRNLPALLDGRVPIPVSQEPRVRAHLEDGRHLELDLEGKRVDASPAKEGPTATPIDYLADPKRILSELNAQVPDLKRCQFLTIGRTGVAVNGAPVADKPDEAQMYSLWQGKVQAPVRGAPLPELACENMGGCVVILSEVRFDDIPKLIAKAKAELGDKAEVRSIKRTEREWEVQTTAGYVRFDLDGNKLKSYSPEREAKPRAKAKADAERAASTEGEYLVDPKRIPDDLAKLAPEVKTCACLFIYEHHVLLHGVPDDSAQQGSVTRRLGQGKVTKDKPFPGAICSFGASGKAGPLRLEDVRFDAISKLIVAALDKLGGGEKITYVARSAHAWRVTVDTGYVLFHPDGKVMRVQRH